jgi:cobyrinic acid a,c-diamide synthase
LIAATPASPESIPRIVIAGVSSGVGKTTVTVGLIAALRRLGLVVQPFKCGPDYIDPSYHTRAAGRVCRNLDTWMLDDRALIDSFVRACAGAHIAVIEGVMGMFDGCDWHDERGSTAQIAKLLAAPVLLTVDISGAARSAAALVLGYQTFDAGVALRGVVLNFAGSERHASGCGEAIAAATGLPTIGWLPRESRLQIPERHLGLVPGTEQADAGSLIEYVADSIAARIKLDAVVVIANAAARGKEPVRVDASTASDVGGAPAAASTVAASTVAVSTVAVSTVAVSTLADAQEPVARKHRPVIAVARDAAFCFYYPDNLELLVEAGAAIEFFSPLGGERPPREAAGVYLGGGYPELHGVALAANTAFWDALKGLHARDAPIYAECGGFMVLTHELMDAEGHTWPMAGLLPGGTRMTGKLAALGYRHATALKDNLLARAGESVRGHEFRYSTWTCTPESIGTACAWQVNGARTDGPVSAMGYVDGNLLASYLHVHFGQRPELARRFVEKLRSPTVSELVS